MRNWLIHGYDVVDPEIVWSTIVDDLPKLRAVVCSLLETADGSAI